MSSEKFLIKLFDKFTESDFHTDEFLSSFYKFFKKEKSDNLFLCYTEYLTRNLTFTDTNHKLTTLKNMYDEIKYSILYKDEDDINTGFIDQKERKENTDRRLLSVNSISHVHSDVPVNSGTPVPKNKSTVKLNKAKALRILSTFINQSYITYDRHEENTTKEDQEYRECATDIILDEIKNLDGRVLPLAKKDTLFGKRVDMLNVWHDTENKCKELTADVKLTMLISKLFFIDVFQLQNKQPKISTVFLKEICDILPQESFNACYTNNKYKTIISLSNSHPIDVTIARSSQKIKTLYICAGSQMISGGNSDQGIDVAESMLYLTSTYSVGIEKSLHAFPLEMGQVLLCPNVLVFKNTNYVIQPVQKWQRIAVMNAPSKWRPKLCNTTIDISEQKDDIDIYDLKTSFVNKDDIINTKALITGMMEAALFYGYDTVILDDRAIEDNRLPAYMIAKIIKEELTKFDGRFKEVVICANKANSFNVFRCFFNM
jgi:hypothetical protein